MVVDRIVGRCNACRLCLCCGIELKHAIAELVKCKVTVPAAHAGQRNVVTPLRRLSALGLVPRDGAVVLGRREFRVVAMAENSTLEIVKPSSPACAAGFGAPLSMAECKHKRAYLRKSVDRFSARGSC